MNTGDAMGANITICNNDGYITEHSRLATILNGNTSVAIAHGLSSMPTLVTVTGTHTEVDDYSVTSINATQFTINANAPVTANRDVYWEAKIR